MKTLAITLLFFGISCELLYFREMCLRKEIELLKEEHACVELKLRTLLENEIRKNKKENVELFFINRYDYEKLLNERTIEIDDLIIRLANRVYINYK